MYGGHSHLVTEPRGMLVSERGTRRQRMTYWFRAEGRYGHTADRACIGQLDVHVGFVDLLQAPGCSVSL